MSDRSVNKVLAFAWFWLFAFFFKNLSLAGTAWWAIVLFFAFMLVPTYWLWNRKD